MLRVLIDNLRVLLRVMGKTVKSTSNPDNWYQKSLGELASLCTTADVLRAGYEVEENTIEGIVRVEKDEQGRLVATPFEHDRKVIAQTERRDHLGQPNIKITSDQAPTSGGPPTLELIGGPYPEVDGAPDPAQEKELERVLSVIKMGCELREQVQGGTILYGNPEIRRHAYVTMPQLVQMLNAKSQLDMFPGTAVALRYEVIEDDAAILCDSPISAKLSRGIHMTHQPAGERCRARVLRSSLFQIMQCESELDNYW